LKTKLKPVSFGTSTGGGVGMGVEIGDVVGVGIGFETGIVVGVEIGASGFSMKGVEGVGVCGS